MTRNTILVALGAATLGAGLSPAPTQAQTIPALTLTLTQPFQFAIPANTLANPIAFYGTITNTGTTPIFLYDAAFSAGIPGITLDATPFEFNAPTELYGVNDSTGPNSFSGELFTATVNSDEPLGAYSSQFDVLAGAGPDPSPGPFATVTDNTAATASFTVAAVPEPAPPALLVLGLLPVGLTLAARRRRAA